jgi:hypothetical protein
MDKYVTHKRLSLNLIFISQNGQKQGFTGMLYVEF